MSASGVVNPVEILLVEDNPGDIRLTQEAVKEAKLANRLNIVSTGADALAFLRREGRFRQAPRPDLVLLDLDLPVMDGREVLRQVKADPVLRPIPVVVLTGSPAEEDILRAYDSNANCYVKKPLDFEQFLCVVQSVQQFWLTTVTLPPQAEGTQMGRTP